MCVSLGATANRTNRQKQSESIGKSSLNLAQARVCGTVSVAAAMLGCKHEEESQEQGKIRLQAEASKAVVMAVLAGYTCGVGWVSSSSEAVAARAGQASLEYTGTFLMVEVCHHLLLADLAWYNCQCYD